MRYLASYLTPVGALVMLICCFLPWLVVDCHGFEEQTPSLTENHVAQFSGLDLARARPLLWGIPASAALILVAMASRLPIRWRYRVSLVIALGGLVFLAISYEELRSIDRAHLLMLLQQREETRQWVESLPDDLEETIQRSLDWLDRPDRTTGIEIAVEFRQAYSLAWAGCALAIVSSLTVLIRLPRRRPEN